MITGGWRQHTGAKVAKGGDELARLIEAKQWARAAEIQEWSGDRSEREYDVVRCPHTSMTTLVSVIATAPLWSNDFIEWKKMLNAEDADAVSKVVGPRWIRL